jgi:hypothetical protein
MATQKTDRDGRVIALAQRISKIMQRHTDRFEALDAHTMAGIFYRGKSIPLTARRHPAEVPQSVQ